MTSQELVDVVTDYIEGRLPHEPRRRFDEHVASCPGCRMYLAQIRETISLTGTLREEDLSPRARDALLAVLRNWNLGEPT